MAPLAAIGFLLILEGAAAIPNEYEPIPTRDIRHDHISVEGWSSNGVVFVRYLDRQKNPDSYHVAVASFDGRERQVIGGGGPDCAFEASVNPSGTGIAYPGDADYSVEYDQWFCDIFLVRTDGSEPRNLTNTPFELGRANHEFAPTWAPDGTAIAYERNSYSARVENWNHDVVVLELASGSTRVVGRGRSAFWSPDSRHLAFSSGLSERDSAVFSVRRDGSGRRRLTSATGWSAAGWSPNGRQLLIQWRSTSLRSTIWTVNADGSAKRRLARGQYATWSPRGDWIAFRRPVARYLERYIYPDSSLLLIRPNGTARRSLGAVRGLGFAWAPDGRRLAVPRQRRCLRLGVYMVDISGKSRPVTNDCRMRGTSRKDLLVGTEEPDLVWGFAGSDRIDTNPGDRWAYGWGGDADIVWAGAGNDVVRTGPSRDTIYGGLGADRIAGGGEADVLFGGAGDDLLRGGNNRDLLDGGAGRDRLFGDNHADVLRIRDGEVDTVVCGSGWDRVLADSLDRISADCEAVSGGPR